MPNLRENFDYVSFENYRSDMDELAALGGAAAEELKRQLKASQMLVAALVKGAGGRIDVNDEDMYMPTIIEQTYDEEHRKMIFRTHHAQQIYQAGPVDAGRGARLEAKAR